MIMLHNYKGTIVNTCIAHLCSNKP
uniref:Uncharacterized protein n=1 Tax=Arundo donax TaxID=35708 RepID=A0A0A9ABM4_ARUDO